MNSLTEFRADFRIVKGAFGRFYIAHPDSDYLFWSGARWVYASNGIPVGIVQICNFDTAEEAKTYADERAKNEM